MGIAVKEIAMNRKHALKLTADKRAWLEEIVCTGKRAAWKIQHAHAFLKMDQGVHGPSQEDARIAEAFSMSTRSLENWCKQAVEEGPKAVSGRILGSVSIYAGKISDTTLRRDPYFETDANI
jgi:hypothetical protein